MMRSIFAAALLLVISATFALGQCSEADKKALEAFDHGWTEANARGDREYLENVYADDYTRTSFTGPANKNEIIEAAVKSAARDKANPQNAANVTADHFIIACTPEQRDDHAPQCCYNYGQRQRANILFAWRSLPREAGRSLASGKSRKSPPRRRDQPALNR
jgi:hypothetical protein